MVLSSLLALALVAQEPVLLADFDTAPSFGPVGSDPGLLTGLFGSLWLRADEDAWRFDPATGTAERLTTGIELAGPPVALDATRAILRLERPVGTISFIGRLVVTDGTALGTETLLSGTDYDMKSDPFLWNGAVYFFQAPEAQALELWTTDGTVAGTQLQFTFPFGPANPSKDVNFAVLGAELLIRDGTATGLAKLTVPAGPLQNLNAGPEALAAELSSALILGGRAVFRATTVSSSTEMWATDGTVAGTVQLAEIAPGQSSASPTLLAGDANRVWFSAVSPGAGRELWITDGTPAGTRMIVDLNPGPIGGVSPFDTDLSRAAILPGGDLIFGGSNTPPVFGSTVTVELFRSDGTAPGTRFVEALQPPGNEGSRPRNFVQAGGVTYFVANVQSVGPGQVFRTDGTSAGTFSIFSPPGLGTGLFSALDTLWIGAELEGLGTELVVSDGTTPGTQVAFEFKPQTTRDGIEQGFESVRLGQELLFPARTVATGRELWATDGTPAGTRLVIDLELGAGNSDPLPRLQLGDRALFTTESSGRRIWVTDGTTAGTRLLADPFTAPNSRKFVRLGDQALFIAGGLAPEELWRTDGTPAGTAFVANVLNNNFSSTAGFEDSAELDGFLYFHGRDSFGARAVWRTDGTPAGTAAFAPIPGVPGSNGSPRIFTRLNDRIYFVGPAGGPAGEALWSTDGTPGGTQRIVDFDGIAPNAFTRLGQQLVYTTNGSSVGREIWATDGTAAGTQLLADINPAGNSSPTDLIAIGDRVYFTAQASGDVERSIWSTDGTPAGTLEVPAQTAPLLSFFSGMRDFGSLEQLLFVGTVEATGYELWRHDPASGAQVPLPQAEPGPIGSDPGTVIELGGRLIFDAYTPQVGRELFALDLRDLDASSAESFGQACGFLAPAATASLLGDIAPGSTPDLILEQAPPASIALAYRSSPTTPLDLGLGCTTELDLANARLLLVTTTDPLGQARTPLPLPATPALSGVAQTVQFVLAEPGGPLLGNFGLSNSVDVVLR